MGVSDFLKSASPENGVAARFDRRHRFLIKRHLDPQGFHTYVLENRAAKEQLVIKRFIFDRFRSVLRKVHEQITATVDPFAFEEKVVFKQDVTHIIRCAKGNLDEIIIQEGQPSAGRTGYIRIARDAIATLDKLLFDPNLQHPNDVLNRIIAYHRLFQFTFTEGSESITSELALRKDVLGQVENYVPGLSRKIDSAQHKFEQADDAADSGKPAKQPKDKGLFKSRLAEKTGEKSYKVDYANLFSGSSGAVAARTPKAPSESARAANKFSFHLPLMAGEIKAMAQSPFRCELTTDDMKELREQFLSSEGHELFVGFEILDAIFRTSSGRLKTFRFPLYYMRVSLKESGRHIYLEPAKDRRLYLNHLGLANLVGTFAKAPAGKDPLDLFFNTLLAQNIETEEGLSRIYISRMLPLSENIFEKTREVILGLPGDQGKGGILGNLNVVGIECDLESVYLYKAAKIRNPCSKSLEDDLAHVQELAVDDPTRFYNSLLGKFLSPEVQSQNRKQKPFAPVPYIPGSLPKSTKRLLGKLDHSDLVLLEGPPGTGKTFTIMNILIHCLCSGKKLLVVSDQKAAIHALLEKVQDYLYGAKRGTAEAKSLDLLMRSAIMMVDDVPEFDAKLETWIKQLKEMLLLSSQTDFDLLEGEYTTEVGKIDAKIAKAKSQIQAIMYERLGPDADIRKRVSQRRFHDSTVDDIQTLIEFLQFMGKIHTQDGDSEVNRQIRFLILRFMKDREYLANTDLETCYSFFQIPERISQAHIDTLSQTEYCLEQLLKRKPVNVDQLSRTFGPIAENQILSHVKQVWYDRYGSDQKGFTGFLNNIIRFFWYPMAKEIKVIRRIVKNHKSLIKLGSHVKAGVWRQLRVVHEALSPHNDEALPLSLEICRFSTESIYRVQEQGQSPISIQSYLDTIAQLQQQRDNLIKQQFRKQLSIIAHRSTQEGESGGSSAITKISAMLESIKQSDAPSQPALIQDLQKILVETYPLWLCRKQAVSFLFPGQEQLFDLVIVDEATQCKVDDALPLLFRAKKLMVVGDEKQTVLAKNSAIDDYLFREFNLEEHLRTTQARGLKGGGSHIFGLVKAIREASVMLDEHYRCPPEIISFSNKYVYGGELKTMQWRPLGMRPSVVVDWSEQKAQSSIRREGGKYKGIETEMVDRFLEFVAKKVKEIERETGKRIDVSTDVALCYFLLKNEPYIKDMKPEWLRRLKRGEDILDGAGAALQGKERDYIFYLWDVSRANMMAFRQGDDEDKRKGELNVLMSRPKKRAFHYLHKNFDRLDHRKATITDYLWNAYNQQSEKDQVREFQPRTHRPSPQMIPWRRSSGQLIAAILDGTVGTSASRPKSSQLIDSNDQFQFSVVVGDPGRKVDLVIQQPASAGTVTSTGIIDICGFDYNERVAEEIVDYYFQLKRAQPKLDPVFLFIHELASETSDGFQRLQNRLTERKQSKKAS